VQSLMCLLRLVVGVLTPGSLDRRVNLSLRVPAQMGWREMEHKGKNAARVIPRQGGVLVVGVQAFARERVSLSVSSFSRATLAHEGPGPPFYRCKERVQVYNGGCSYALTYLAERCLSPVYMQPWLSERC
jgi:hypothetical protein